MHFDEDIFGKMDNELDDDSSFDISDTENDSKK